MQTDPHDAVRHAAQSPVALCTKVDTECDQQMTVVGKLLTVLGHVPIAKYCQQQTGDCRSFTRRRWTCRDRNFISTEIGTKFQTKRKRCVS